MPIGAVFGSIALSHRAIAGMASACRHPQGAVMHIRHGADQSGGPVSFDAGLIGDVGQCDRSDRLARPRRPRPPGCSRFLSGSESASFTRSPVLIHFFVKAFSCDPASSREVDSATLAISGESFANQVRFESGHTGSATSRHCPQRAGCRIEGRVDPVPRGGWLRSSRRHLRARRARSISFSSSRTFPGQGWASSRECADGESWQSGVSSCFPSRLRKCSASGRMSCARNRSSGATSIGKTCEPVVKFFPDESLRCFGSEVPVARLYDSHVDIASIVAPSTGRISRSCRTRRSLAWIGPEVYLEGGEIQAFLRIGLLEEPGLVAVGSGDRLPGRDPKSSLSSRLSGKAAQVTAYGGQGGAPT